MTLKVVDSSFPEQSAEEHCFANFDLGPLENAQTVVLATHVLPDGDGIGSQLALQRGLEQLGKTVYIFNADPLPKRYRFLDKEHKVTQARPEYTDVIRNADLFIVVDTNDVHRAGLPYELRGEGKVCVIDHHLGKVAPGVHLLCDPSFSSSGELCYRIMKKMGVEITKEIAEPIYASILYDTGSFRFTRNNPGPLRVAADLLDLGVDAVMLQEHIFAAKPKDLPVLMSRCFQRVKYEYGRKIAWTIVTQKDLEGLELDVDGLRELMTVLGNLDDVDVAFLIKEDGPGLYRLSLRAKSHVSIFSIAQSRGGGGHAQAAGAPLRGEAGALAKEIVSEIIEIFEQN